MHAPLPDISPKPITFDLSLVSVLKSFLGYFWMLPYWTPWIHHGIVQSKLVLSFYFAFIKSDSTIGAFIQLHWALCAEKDVICISSQNRIENYSINIFILYSPWQHIHYKSYILLGKNWFSVECKYLGKLKNKIWWALKYNVRVRVCSFNTK